MKKPAKLHPLVEAAREYVGYTARPGASVFQTDLGYSGELFQWDGAFIDRVFKDADLEGPAHLHTASALAFYIRNGLVRRKPAAGDLVFFAFSGEGGKPAFESPHIGVVTDVSQWKSRGTIRVIEGEVSNGLPKSPQDGNGVYERTRYATDVLAFVRTRKTKRNVRADLAESSTLHIVKIAHLNRCTSAAQAASAKPEYRKSVELVQLALAEHPAVQLRNAERGVYNSQTRAAIGAFQRYHGLANATGVLDLKTLEALAASQSPRTFTASE